MLSIGWIMFGKAVVISLWVLIFGDKDEDAEWKGLLAKFKAEWDRRRAKQPLALTYRPADAPDSVGTVGKDRG